jgi:hypothetical protein
MSISSGGALAMRTLPSSVLQGRGGEAEPAGAYAEGDLVGADFYYGVLSAVEAVGGCVAAQQGCPGGPEFDVELSIRH